MLSRFWLEGDLGGLDGLVATVEGDISEGCREASVIILGGEFKLAPLIASKLLNV